MLVRATAPATCQAMRTRPGDVGKARLRSDALLPPPRVLRELTMGTTTPASTPRNAAPIRSVTSRPVDPEGHRAHETGESAKYPCVQEVQARVDASYPVEQVPFPVHPRDAHCVKSPSSALSA